MTFQEITDLIKVLSKSRLAEFKMKDGDFEISIKTDRYKDTKTPKIVSTNMPMVAAAPVPAPAPPPPVAEPAPVKIQEKAATATEEKADESKYIEIKSPMVGTFYRSASPEKPVYVEVGQKINSGDVVCIIEAMKLFNEIEAEVSGKIVKVMVDNAQPVEYDQVLFLVEPS
ncbi:MAG TPA: acetyl-CoA carboxylase biotin carboxyl carrier protein [Bacteroidetes bacterium]|nr:acetyl-CoA carboxylase biotin carboxyl carrier protein [Bacteroidota bacterium]